MKKIMFSDKYGLTQAVLEGKKTMTRRFLPCHSKNKITKKVVECLNSGFSFGFISRDKLITHDIDETYYVYRTRYDIGDVIAIAQRYKDIFSIGWKSELTGNEAGWHNKMFAKAEYMPHQIQITNVKLEHLQEISDEDCLKEGITLLKEDESINMKYYGTDKRSLNVLEYTPREAFASLIDKVSGKGTWESNPWVFVYEFKFIK